MPQKNELPPEVVKALQSSGKVELYSLEPREQPTETDEELHGFKVLGHTVLDEKSSAKAIKEFQKAVEDWDGVIAACFDPRHAMRITADGRAYDLLLCYECHQMYIYRDNGRPASLGVFGSSKILRQLLTDAGIPLSSTEKTKD